MEYKVIPEKMDFTSDVMLPHWAYKKYQLLGDSIIAFCGPLKFDFTKRLNCRSSEKNCQLKDIDMLHFVIEHFDSNIRETVLRQYLLVSVVEEKLLHRIPENGHRIIRLGDDLFDGENLLSTTSINCNLVSNKIHLAIFMEANPGPCFHGLEAYRVDPCELAELVINQYRTEMRRLIEKTWKIEPLHGIG